MSFIKIDRRLAERLTLLCGYLSYRGDDSPYVLIRQSYEEGRWKHPVQSLFQNLTREGFNSVRNVDYVDLMEEASTALSAAPSDDSHLPRLVSVIVELLQHPYGQNVLAGDTLRRLRKAVLLPEELAGVSANAAQELKCGHCGKPFAEGEMATFTGGERVPHFQCSRCCAPTQAACGKASCDGSGELDYKALAKSVAKTDCGQHSDKPKVEPIPEEVRRGGIIRDIPVDNPFEGHPDDAPQLAPDPDWRVVGRAEPPPMPAPGAMRERVENEIRRLRERRPRGLR